MPQLSLEGIYQLRLETELREQKFPQKRPAITSEVKYIYIYIFSYKFTLFSSQAVYANPCMPGYFGLYCQPCPVGTYKDDFTNDQCKNCTNSPDQSKPDTTKGWNGESYLCPYICDAMTVQEGSRTLCLNYFQYYTRYVGGLPGVSILVFFCIIVVGLILHKNSNKRSRKAQRIQSLQRSTILKGIPGEKGS